MNAIAGSIACLLCGVELQLGVVALSTETMTAAGSIHAQHTMHHLVYMQLCEGRRRCYGLPIKPALEC